MAKLVYELKLKQSDTHTLASIYFNKTDLEQ